MNQTKIRSNDRDGNQIIFTTCDRYRILSFVHTFFVKRLVRKEVETPLFSNLVTSPTFDVHVSTSQHPREDEERHRCG